MTDTCLRLARVGFDALLSDLGGPTPASQTDESGAVEAHAAIAADHRRVRDLLLSTEVQPRQGGLDGARWVRLIDWPDRVPGLKTWAGNATLPKILRAHQRRLRGAEGADLFAARGAYRTAKGEGPSGLDAGTCQDAIDVGFSPTACGMDIQCRPAVELLAVVGLQSLPLLSFGPRVCGFVHNERLWQFPVEPRAGGYYYRWGALAEWAEAP